MEGRNTKPTEHAAQMEGNGHKILIGKSHDNYWKVINICIYICVCVCAMVILKCFLMKLGPNKSSSVVSFIYDGNDSSHFTKIRK